MMGKRRRSKAAKAGSKGMLESRAQGGPLQPSCRSRMRRRMKRGVHLGLHSAVYRVEVCWGMC